MLIRSSLLSGVFACLFTLAAVADPPREVGLGGPEDVASKLQPAHSRTEEEQDRVKATALYAQARVMFQREDSAGALRRYQRAWRYDPQSVSILREVVPLAAELERLDEAGRYAVIAAEADPQNEQLLKGLAASLSEKDELEHALLLYEKSLQLHKDNKPEAGQVLLHFEMGRLSFLTQKFLPAAEHFAVVQQALADPKKYGLTDDQQKLLLGKADITYTLFGEASFQSGRFDEADTLFRKAIAAKPNAPMLAFYLGRSEFGRGHHAQALAKLEEYFTAKIATAGLEPYETLEKILKAQEKDPDTAFRKLREKLTALRENDPGNAPLTIFLGDRLRQAKDYEKAEALYVDQLKLQPTAESYRGLVAVYLAQKKFAPLAGIIGEASQQQGSLQDVADEVKKLTDDKELSRAFLAAVRPLSADDLKKLSPAAAFASGLVALDAKQFDTAGELLEKAVTCGAPEKPQLYLAWGLGLFLGEQYEASAKIFRRAIQEKALPDNKAHVSYLLASSLEFAGHTEEALQAAREAIAQNPKIPRYQSRLAWIPYHAKQYSIAAEAYRMFIDQYEKDFKTPGVREELREARLALSHVYTMLKDPAQAEEMLEQVLDEFPDDEGAGNDLSFLWSERGLHLQRALKMAQAAVKKEPENEAYRDSLGWVLFMLGRPAEAITELELAAKVEKPDGVILDHLADAYFKAGKKDLAIATWKRALEAFREQKENDKLQAIETKLKQ